VFAILSQGLLNQNIASPAFNHCVFSGMLKEIPQNFSAIQLSDLVDYFLKSAPVSSKKNEPSHRFLFFQLLIMLQNFKQLYTYISSA